MVTKIWCQWQVGVGVCEVGGPPEWLHCCGGKTASDHTSSNADASLRTAWLCNVMPIMPTVLPQNCTCAARKTHPPVLAIVCCYGLTVRGCEGEQKSGQNVKQHLAVVRTGQPASVVEVLVCTLSSAVGLPSASLHLPCHSGLLLSGPTCISGPLTAHLLKWISGAYFVPLLKLQ